MVQIKDMANRKRGAFAPRPGAVHKLFTIKNLTNWKIYGIIYIAKIKERNIMQTTNIVRRIDNLGRVVIPKGIRSQMNIQENDEFEIQQRVQHH